MKALVIGAGEVGTNVARTLSADRHEVTLIESDPERCEQAREELDALVVEGNGASPKVLQEQGAAEMDLVAAVTTIDEVNIAAAVAVRSRRKSDRKMTTIARVRDPDFFGRDEGTARGVFGIDLVIDPDRVAAEDIAETVRLPGAVSVEYFEDESLVLAEVIVTEQSPLAGVPLQERERPYPAFIVGLTRGGEPRLSRPEMVPQPGDHLLVVSTREYARKAIAHFAGHVNEVRSCVIFGGGKIGLHLARLLTNSKIETTILERDARRARFLAERLPKVTVLHDEGISKDAQRLAGVDHADAFVACAGDDRANLLAALYGKRLGADLCLATVSREEFTPLVDALGIDAAFSPRLIAAEEILSFVHTKSVKEIRLLRTGFEAMELEVQRGAKIVGQKIGETHGRLAHCRVGAVLRDDEYTVPPRSGTPIEDGDRLLILGPLGTLSEVEKYFAGDE